MARHGAPPPPPALAPAGRRSKLLPVRYPLLFLLLIAVSAAHPRSAVAQTGGGAIRGVVYDSLLHAPLASAEVWLRGTERREFTDRAGRFGFDSVPIGRQGIAVSH